MNNLLSDEWVEKWIDPEFREKVAIEINEANIRVNEYVALVRHKTLIQQKKDDPEKAKRIIAERRAAKVCVGCGCKYDDTTPGCVSCQTRHFTRKYMKSQKVQKIEKAEWPKGTCRFCMRSAPIIENVLKCVRCGAGSSAWKRQVLSYKGR